MTAEAAPTELLACADGVQTSGRLHSISGFLLASGGARLVVLPVSAVCGLIGARLTTLAVGIDQFGAVMLVATLSQLLMFADLGAGAAVATGRAKAHETRRELRSSSERCSRRFAPLCAPPAYLDSPLP